MTPDGEEFGCTVELIEQDREDVDNNTVPPTSGR